MPNLYVWFPNARERREFVIELLELENVLPEHRSKKAFEKAELQYSACL